MHFISSSTQPVSIWYLKYAPINDRAPSKRTFRQTKERTILCWKVLVYLQFHFLNSPRKKDSGCIAGVGVGILTCFCQMWNLTEDLFCRVFAFSIKRNPEKIPRWNSTQIDTALHSAFQRNEIILLLIQIC